MERFPIRLLLCDDHPVVTEALAQNIRGESDLEMVAEPMSDPEQAVGVCERLKPDVVVMDIQFGGEPRGIDATRHIREVCPDAKVLILTGFADDDALFGAIQAGASGLVQKGEMVARILGAIRAVAAGESVFDPKDLVRGLRSVSTQQEEGRADVRLFEKLTKREREILETLATGLRAKEIAPLLSISPLTVETHTRNILAKLGVRSKLEAVAMAVRAGVVSPGQTG